MFDPVGIIEPVNLLFAKIKQRRTDKAVLATNAYNIRGGVTILDTVGKQSTRWVKPDAWLNIHQIIEADVQAGYTYKDIYLMADDAVSTVFTVDASKLAYKLSDGPTLITETTTHTWNTANDINNTRWVIVYCAAQAVIPSLPFEALWLDGWNTLLSAGSAYTGKSRLRCIDGVFNNNFSGTNCANLFAYCYSLASIPGVIDMTNCTSALNMFISCYSLLRVPDVLNLAACNTTAAMFSGCNSLARVPDVLNLAGVTTTSAMFSNCASLACVPDVLNLTACATAATMFHNCACLLNTPTDITIALASDALVALNFAACARLRKASVCTFDGDGAVNGGLVFSLDTVTTARALTLNATVKALFTGDEQTAVANYVTGKGWTLTW